MVCALASAAVHVTGPASSALIGRLACGRGTGYQGATSRLAPTLTLVDALALSPWPSTTVSVAVQVAPAERVMSSMRPLPAPVEMTRFALVWRTGARATPQSSSHESRQLLIVPGHALPVEASVTVSPAVMLTARPALIVAVGGGDATTCACKGRDQGKSSEIAHQQRR